MEDTETVLDRLDRIHAVRAVDPIGYDDLITAVDKGFRRLDLTMSIGLGLIAGAIIGMGIGRHS